MSIKSTIVTRSGKLFDFRDPRPEAIDLGDICESLAKQCRFTGHCKGFYSNAAHSMFVAEILVRVLKRPELRLEGLLHEGNEPYMNDVSSPLKGQCPDYKAIQNRVEPVVEERFLLQRDPAIKKADWMAYCVEQETLMPKEAVMVDKLAGRAPDASWAVGLKWPVEFVSEYAYRGSWFMDRVEFLGHLIMAMAER